MVGDRSSDADATPRGCRAAVIAGFIWLREPTSPQTVVPRSWRLWPGGRSGALLGTDVFQISPRLIANSVAADRFEAPIFA